MSGFKPIPDIGATYYPALHAQLRVPLQSVDNLDEEKVAHKSVISLHPPWTSVFQGERVNLTCRGFHVNVTETTTGYCWYKRQEILRETTGNNIVVSKSGEYRCRAPGSLKSNPVRLIFSSESLILQAPHSVFEGDTLILRCQGRKDVKMIAVQYTFNGKVIYKSNKSWELLIPQASLRNSGFYQCIGTLHGNSIFRSNTKNIRIQELFSIPTLKVTPSQPTEGSSVNLSCKTQLSPERQDTLLHFSFFRDGGVTLSGWSRSPKLQITTVWSEDSGAYQCGAKMPTSNISKYSRPLQVHMQRVPVSGVLLEMQPPGGQAVEGQKLVLVCSVAEGTGNTTFSWYRTDRDESLGRMSQSSQRAELETRVIGKNHAGDYFCTADNGYGLLQSKPVNITVRETPGYRSGTIAAGVTGALLSILLATALLFHCWPCRKSGDGFPEDNVRIPPTPCAGEPRHPMCPAPVELRLLYVHSQQEEMAYSEIRIIKLGEEGEASVSRTTLEDMNAPVVYAELKTQLPDDSAEKVTSKDEDAMESYENVLLM
ncbi:Fc receptor-like protein 4 [Talpa occidentalis]|uniref:Fc receptor-like protein 4 n=1 Tax=Talpa occidentalis TaxID=50954 RepID=UPI00188F5F5C|nr:Fc receptor-like protein 4 [Talpa occidentalis]